MKLTNEQIEFIRRWETFIVNTGGNLFERIKING